LRYEREPEGEILSEAKDLPLLAIGVMLSAAKHLCISPAQGIPKPEVPGTDY